MGEASLHPTRQRMLDVFGVERLHDFRGPAWTRIELIPDATAPDRLPQPFTASARLLRELDTARAVVAAMFGRSERVTLELGWSSHEKPPFKRLSHLGFDLPRDPAWRLRPDPQDAPDWWWNLAYVETPAAADALAPFLLAAVGGFQKRGLINLSVGIVDFETGLALEFYDAKGMTPMAVTPERLAPVYWRFRDWVRDVEIERCDALLAPWWDAAPRLTVV